MRDTTKGPTSRSAFASLAGGFLPAMAPTTQTAKPLVTTQAPSADRAKPWLSTFESANARARSVR